MVPKFATAALIIFLFRGQFALADVVTDWNSVALDAIRARNTPPPAASRNLAILHTAIYDAVNGIHRIYKPYLITPLGPPEASMEAAAAAAAHQVMFVLYPELAARIDLQYENSLSAIPPGAPKTAGIQWGQSVASVILEWRSYDGFASAVSYTVGTQPGLWRPTISFGNVVRPALLPHWGSVIPFALGSGEQFRPPAPPALNSPQYAAEVNEVKLLGAKDSTIRTPDETKIAQFWAYGLGTATPPGHWNQIALAVVQSNTCTTNCNTSRTDNIESTARLFALLNIAMADAAITCWNAKYIYNLWRPITAIREADTDGNPDTVPDSTWTPYLETPPFPEYTSGHSTFSGASAAVLSYFFGADQIPFSVGSDDIPGYKRSYTSFSHAAEESGRSRVYSGIHFTSANIQGLRAGAAVGTYVTSNLLTPQEAAATPPESILAAAIKLDPPVLKAGGSFTGTVTGIAIANGTFIDTRFRGPGITVDQEAFNWQRGVSVTHTMSEETSAGLWTITGVRAHQNEADHTGSYIPVSIGLLVLSSN